jgi:Alpha/beta hydrolase domain
MPRFTTSSISIRSLSGTGGDNPPTLFCGLAGYHLDYDESKLCKLYGSRSGYVHAVETTTKLAERAGFVLKADADQTIKDARSIQLSAFRGGSCSSSKPPPR